LSPPATIQRQLRVSVGSDHLLLPLREQARGGSLAATVWDHGEPVMDNFLSQDVAASYSRLSCETQAMSSIVQQQRKCREAAEKTAKAIPPELEFADEGTRTVNRVTLGAGQEPRS
jgi:hypothetical protein